MLTSFQLRREIRILDRLQPYSGGAPLPAAILQPGSARSRWYLHSRLDGLDCVRRCHR